MNKSIPTLSGFDESAAQALLDAEATLKRWAEQVSGFSSVNFEPVMPGENEAVKFILTGLSEGERVNGGRHRPHLHSQLTYAVVVASEDGLVQRQALFALFSAVRDHDEYQLAPERVPREISGPDCPASFAICVPVCLRRSQENVPLVLGGAAVDSVAVVRLEGCVSGPAGIPVSRAVVRINRLNRKSVCDNHGRFRFDAIPEGEQIELEIEARGRKTGRIIHPEEHLFVEIKMDF